MSTALESLAATPPPQSRWKFSDIRLAKAEITRLESQLSIRHRPQISNLAAANRRLKELESMVHEQSAAAATKVRADLSSQPAAQLAAETNQTIATVRASVAAAEVKASSSEGVLAGRRMAIQRASLAGVDVSKLSGIELECANRLLGKS